MRSGMEELTLCHVRSKRRSESLRRRRCQFWGPLDCPCSQGAPRRQPLDRRQPRRRHRTSRPIYQPFSAKRKSPTSIWPPSMCSTRKAPECRRAACSSPEEAAAVAGAAAVAEAAAEDAAMDAASAAAEAVVSAAEGAVAPAASHGAPAAGARVRHHSVVPTDAVRHVQMRTAHSCTPCVAAHDDPWAATL